MRYIMNSAVITSPGVYEYRLLTVTEAREWLAKGPTKSLVGYPDTARFIERVLGVKVELSREQVILEHGDEALIVRLKYRVQDPGQKGQFTPRDEDFEIGLVVKR